MAQRKESFFWTSYSDLMTSLFFVMLVLFVLVIVLLHKSMEATEQQLRTTEQQLREIQKVEQSTKDLSKEYFEYRPEYKKYVLRTQVRFPAMASSLNNIQDKKATLEALAGAGREISAFLHSHKDNQYILIIEGQASRDFYAFNYELSYERALALMRFWVRDCKIDFGTNCEIQIAGSGDGTLPTLAMRDSEEAANQRFLIHILPKNIFENNESE